MHIWTVSQRVQCIGSSCSAISECGLTVPPDLVMAGKKGGCIYVPDSLRFLHYLCGEQFCLKIVIEYQFAKIICAMQPIRTLTFLTKYGLGGKSNYANSCLHVSRLPCMRKRV